MPNDRRNAQDGPRSVARRDFVRSAALLAAGLAAAGRVDSATAGEPSQGAGRVREFIRKVQNARLLNGNLTPLPPQFEITARHLARAAKAQQVELERGDTVLIRTGWGQYFGANPALYKGDFSPGPGVEGAQFLIDAGARVVGNDTLTFEQRPPILGTPGTPSFQVFPVHMLVIADHGINIIENFFLEELAEARVYEFLLVVPPLKIRGGTGSALRSFALTPGPED